jgi:type I restriction enzyme, S subunit
VPERTGLCVGQRMMYLRPDPQLLDAKLLLQTIYGPTVRRYIEVSFAGSTVAHLRFGQVTSLPMPWCPVDEQRQIVRYVKTETCGLNKAAERAQVAINLLKEFRTRIISDVVPGNLDVRQAAAALPDESPDDADVKILDDDTDDEENVESTDEESDE